MAIAVVVGPAPQLPAIVAHADELAQALPVCGTCVADCSCLAESVLAQFSHGTRGGSAHDAGVAWLARVGLVWVTLVLLGSFSVVGIVVVWPIRILIILVVLIILIILIVLVVLVIVLPVLIVSVIVVVVVRSGRSASVVFARVLRWASPVIVAVLVLVSWGIRGRGNTVSSLASFTSAAVSVISACLGCLG